jgi:5-methyltetrahydrofolate--homocysteine methyltransferase
VIVVAERINATRSSVRRIISERDAPALADLARGQADAGCTYVDVNVGTGVGEREDEIASMEWAVKVVAEATPAPISVDSADPGVLEAGLRAAPADRQLMVNSAKAVDESLDAVVPLAVRHKAMLVGLALDERGLPGSVDERLRACERIVEACKRLDQPLDRLLLDPLVIPLGTDIRQARWTLDAATAIHERLAPARALLGLSNVSFGLPQRRRLNIGFLTMAIYAGVEAALLDALDTDLMEAITTAEALAGKDRHCRRYTRKFRK